jgi:hypothetical protein
MKPEIRIQYVGIKIVCTPDEHNAANYESQLQRNLQMNRYGTATIKTVLSDLKNHGLADQVNKAYQKACDKARIKAIGGLALGSFALYFGAELEPGISDKICYVLGGISVFGNSIMLGLNELRGRSFEQMLK